MSQAWQQMNGLSLHFYTLPTGDWGRKGSATQFGEAEWHATLARTLRMDEIIRNQSAIMDKYDQQKRVGLIVDEWGTWYDPEPGRDLGALYQQNSIRDAIVAAVNLNIFNQHCDRVQMANIAQMINVLQAIILTDKDRIMLTPTYPAGLRASSACFIASMADRPGRFRYRASIRIRARTPSLRSLLITQDAAPFTCRYTISPASIDFGSNADQASALVTSGNGCNWVAVSNDGWVSITSGSAGAGNGTMTFTVTQNAGAYRTGTITIARQTLSVSQKGSSVALQRPSEVKKAKLQVRP
jgi:hypothetical protein